MVAVTPIDIRNIPDELKALPNWVLWRYVTRNGSKTKIPYAVDGFEADVTNSMRWGTFEEIWQAHLIKTGSAGIGFVFTKESGIVGVDIDHVVVGGTFDPDVKKYIDFAGSYTEFSPSLQGVHIFCAGVKPGERCRHGRFEMYDSARFFTVTGNSIAGTGKGLVNAQPAIDLIYNEQIRPDTEGEYGISRPELKKSHVCSVINSVSPRLSDSEILKKCIAARNSRKFMDLFNGKTGAYNSVSEAEYALCRLLAFYTRDHEQIVRLMVRSKLSRTKWFSHPTYLINTVSRAIAAGGAVYGQ